MSEGSQKFYELTPDGREVKQPQKIKSVLPRWILFALAGIGIGIVIVLLVVLILNLIGGDDQISEQAEQTLEQQYADCEDSKDPNACQSALRSELAREMGEISICEGLSSNEYANCISLIAYDRVDESLCNVLDSDEKNNCKDLVYQIKSKDELSLKFCRKIVDETLMVSCEKQITSLIIASGLCAEYDVDVSLCDAKRLMEDAATSGDANACEALGGESAEICLDIIVSVDEDKDGLTRKMEFENGTNDHDEDSDDDGLMDGDEVLYYGTSPINLDTDGDGYSDFEEVMNGFNPLLGLFRNSSIIKKMNYLYV